MVISVNRGIFVLIKKEKRLKTSYFYGKIRVNFVAGFFHDFMCINGCWNYKFRCSSIKLKKWFSLSLLISAIKYTFTMKT